MSNNLAPIAAIRATVMGTQECQLTAPRLMSDYEVTLVNDNSELSSFHPMNTLR